MRNKRQEHKIKPNVTFGIKGFDKDLVCMKQQYKIGETYSMDVRPKLCSHGFHYSQTIQETFSFYPNNGSNRYCVIEALGDIDWGAGKSCTNKIKIVREIMPNEILGKKSYDSKSMRELCDMGFAIGGSMALRIYGYSFDREVTDLDLVCSVFNPDEVEKQFGGYKSLYTFSGGDSVFAYHGLFGEKYDIILCPKERFHTVKRVFDGIELTLMDEDEIWAAKLKYALNGSLKHAKDIMDNKINFRPIRPYTSSVAIEEMPF